MIETVSCLLAFFPSLFLTEPKLFMSTTLHLAALYWGEAENPVSVI